MRDSLDLQAIRQQVARIEQRVTAIRLIFGLFCCLIAVGGLAFLLVAPQAPLTCSACISSLGVTLLVLSLSLFVLLLAVTSLSRPFLFSNQRQRLELLKSLHLSDVPKVSSPAINYRRIIFTLFVLSLAVGFIIPFVTKDASVQLAMGVIVAIMLLAVFAVVLIPVYVQMRIYLGLLQKGEYETALREIMQLRRRFPNQAEYVNLAGTIFSNMDRGAEAEQAYRIYLASHLGASNPLLLGVALNNLAYEYVMGQRYEDAMPLLEAAVKTSPLLPQPYHTLALLYLEQNLNPERALELSEWAVKFTSRWQRDAKAAFTTTQAWAAALAGRASDAEDLLNRAFQLVNPKLPAILAYLHWAAGQAKLASRDINIAQSHFSTAVRLDPNGRTGHKAQHALDQMQDNL